jgi:secondary thiamine-phosphate synthase enzyme
MHTIEIRTDRRRQMVDVTQKVQRALDELQAGDGLCLVWVPHTTAAVTVNENADPDVTRDLVAAFEAMLPAVEFHHAEGNSDAHLLSTLIGASLTVPVEDGRLCLGTWQGLYFVELDGPRSRRLWVGFR